MPQRLLTMIEDVEGAPLLMIGAMEGIWLQHVVCCIVVSANGSLKHLAFRSCCLQAAEGRLCQLCARMHSVTPRRA